MAFILPHNNRFLARPYCEVSSIYDDVHLARYGTTCRRRHHKFQWEAKIETRGTLISDSICKWVSGQPYLQVQACPGLSIESALTKIVNGQINVYDIEFIILHVSTNNVGNLQQTLQQYQINLLALIACIQQSSPFATLAVSGILPRPTDFSKDDAVDLIEHRLDMNKIIQRVCEYNHLSYLEVWDKFENGDGSTKFGLYANDMLHPNLAGTRVLYDFYQGALGSIMGRKYDDE